MLRNRYLKILRFLHFVNNDTAPDRADPSRVKLCKIEPFFNAIPERFTAVYAPSQKLSWDETHSKDESSLGSFCI